MASEVSTGSKMGVISDEQWERELKAALERRQQSIAEWEDILADTIAEQPSYEMDVTFSMGMSISDFLAKLLDGYKSEMEHKRPGFTIKYSLTYPSGPKLIPRSINPRQFSDAQDAHIWIYGRCSLQMEDGREILESPLGPAISFYVRRKGDSIDIRAQCDHPAFSIRFNELLTELNVDDKMIGSILTKPDTRPPNPYAMRLPPGRGKEPWNIAAAIKLRADPFFDEVRRRERQLSKLPIYGETFMSWMSDRAALGIPTGVTLVRDKKWGLIPTRSQHAAEKRLFYKNMLNQLFPERLKRKQKKQ